MTMDADTLEKPAKCSRKMDPKELAAPVDVDALEKRLREDGVVVIENVYSEDQLDRATTQHDAILAQFLDDDKQGKVEWVTNKVLHKVPKFNLCRALYHDVEMAPSWDGGNFAIRLNKGRYDLSGAIFDEGILGSVKFRYPHPVRELVERMLKTDYADMVGSLPSNAKSNTGRWHRDIGSLFEEEAIDASLPPIYLTMLIPLVDLTAENGATELKLGSHKLPFEEGMKQPSWHAVSSPGSVVLFDARVVHRGGPNLTDDPRHVLYMTFIKRWWAEESMENYNTLEKDALLRGVAGDPNQHLFT